MGVIELNWISKSIFLAIEITNSFNGYCPSASWKRDSDYHIILSVIKCLVYYAYDNKFVQFII